MKKFFTLFVALVLSGFSIAQQNVTFSVDMNSYTGAFTTVYASGDFNSWDGSANPLTNNGNGIWSVTLPISAGEHEFKFQLDQWANQENFTQGDVCTITNEGFTNRRFVVETADITLPTPNFADCAEYNDGSGSFNVTFTVDMSGYSGAFTTVYLSGENYNNQGFGNWCGDCIPLTDNGDGTWSVTLPLEEYAYQFKFTLDNWANQEMFAVGDPETAHSNGGAYVNRYLAVTQDMSIGFVWNTPGSEILGVEDVQNDAQKISFYPNPVRSGNQIQFSENIQSVEFYNTSGKLMQKSSGNISSVNLPAGVYFITIKDEAGNLQNEKLIVR